MSETPSLTPDPGARRVQVAPDVRRALRDVFTGRFRALLMILVGLMLLLPPLTSVTVYQYAHGSLTLADLASLVALATGILAYFGTRMRWVLLVMFAVAVVATVLARHVPHLQVPCGMVALLTYATLMAALAARIGYDVYLTTDVNGDVICGAVSIYMLIGFAFGSVHAAIVLSDPSAFSIPPDLLAQDPALGPHRVMLYFSLSTLTTSGYGDITPVSDLARSLSNLEAVTGPVFLSVVIARFVSMQLASRGATSG
ncbi:MAG: two pore domain potassium channel family protein [Phycisphaerae bacterium]|nr:two pore domain potassium channel family protein [Phycisphaerae bacterium]